MNSWQDRAHEERNLLNPAFCSTLIWFAAKGASGNATPPRSSLSFTEAFLILPLILHQNTRESLPIRVSSSLPVWINANPLIIASLPKRAQALVPYTREAITFGGSAKIYTIEQNELIVSPACSSRIRTTIRETSVEVQQCMKKAEFLGKWFAHTGSPETIFTLLGVQP